jgi:integrase/recombinase XerC
MGRKGYIGPNVAKQVAMPRVPKHLPVVPSAKKIKRMIESVSAKNSSWASRDRAILELLYGCAILTSELEALNCADIRLDEETISIRGSNQRDLPLGEPAVEALRSYMKERSARLSSLGSPPRFETSALFLHRRLSGPGDFAGEARLTDRSVVRIVKRIGIYAELSQDLHPHILRDACAKHMYENGADLGVVLDLLGLRGSSAEERLKRLSPGRIQKKIDKNHPRADYKPHAAD